MTIDEKALTVAVDAFREAPGNNMSDFLRHTILAYESAKQKEAEGLKLGSRLTVEGVEAVVVPVEPTEAMVDAGMRNNHGGGYTCVPAYAAMLSAAGDGR